MASAQGRKDKGKYLSRIFAAAALAGAYYVMGPAEQTVNPEESSGPNEVQQEFIRLVAQKYDYVLLGDTGHNEPRVGIFGTHKDTVAALADGGKERLFLEAGPSAQSYFEAVAADPAAGPASARRWADRNMWLCGADIKNAVNAEFEKSVHQNQDVRFTGVDQRHAPGSDAHDKMGGFAMKYVVGIPLATYNLVYGCVTSKAFIPGSIALALTGFGEETWDNLTDDRDTAKAIMAYPEKGGAIFYGAAHFADKENTMRSLITAQGYSVGHVNIHIDAKDASRSAPLLEMPAAELYVEDAGDGIKVFTQEMEDLRAQAVENVRVRTVRGPEI